jgi:hypothetical protein
MESKIDELKRVRVRNSWIGIGISALAILMLTGSVLAAIGIGVTVGFIVYGTYAAEIRDELKKRIPDARHLNDFSRKNRNPGGDD